MTLAEPPKPASCQLATQRDITALMTSERSADPLQTIREMRISGSPFFIRRFTNDALGLFRTTQSRIGTGRRTRRRPEGPPIMSEASARRMTREPERGRQGGPVSVV